MWSTTIAAIFSVQYKACADAFRTIIRSFAAAAGRCLPLHGIEYYILVHTGEYMPATPSGRFE